MFKEAIVVGRIFGIPIIIHFTFLLIIPFLAWVFGSNFGFIAERVGIPLENLLHKKQLSVACYIKPTETCLKARGQSACIGRAYTPTQS